MRRLVGRISDEAGIPAPRFSGEPVPSFEDVLLLLKPARLERIYVELKGKAGNQQALLDSVLALMRKHRVDRSITLLSFDHGIIHRAKELASDVRTAALFPAKGRRLISTRSIIRSALSAGVDEVALHFGLATQRSIEAFHERGLSVSVWTANGKRAMLRLAACRTDSIMTNFPNRLRDVLASRNAAQPASGRRR
jgi:glycerophosphoryl diester phosphodiesterase